MCEELIKLINETCDASSWEPLTGIVWQNNQPWQLVKFDADVDYETKLIRVIIVRKVLYDPDDITAVTNCEDVFTEAWEV